MTTTDVTQGAFADRAPAIKRNAVTLRVLGTSVTLLEQIRQQARQDLGINIEFKVLDGVAAQRVGVMSPDSFDVYDQWFHNIDFVWPARAIQPIDIRRLRCWDEINSLPKTGRLLPATNMGLGGTPAQRLFVQPDGSLGARPAEQISMLPVTHNADSFGYRLDMLPAGMEREQESWAWLLDERWRGRVGLQNDSAIGAIDAALAVQAAGLAEFGDIGNLTVEEIDVLIDILIKRKRQGHFRAFWGNYGEAAEQMARGAVGIESLWSPSFVELRKAGIRVKSAAPKEGYRAWYGGMAISTHARGRVLDAAYDYMNWWMSGWAGAVIARQGYYVSNPERARLYLSDAEWAYWYQGEPAPMELPGPEGAPMIPQGEVRDGGSYENRMSRVAVWNSVMDEHNYLVRRWNDFMSA
ncbi:ABC transporter substrate-binding protein [Marinobacterium rhizophilum]|uniref:Extracellular solute-binding protein n=1 Tax=Marinobacterium rhizophilum TaxID=420402 RepID=A0ABY5HIG1_9GAMM|nr:extracellular solute-binding protein [Marinobacterium rhizophilum]UTW11729.1 extracellular solute-binding protein [Marinobacterium rhizophilum]